MARFLYRSDPLKKVNFHNYIDMHPHLLVLVKLTNGRLVAAYSEDPINPDKTILASHGGLLLSLTERRAFKLQPGKRSVTHDDYFVIFGNSEVRLKTQMMQFYTNFGVGSGFYEAEGCKFDVLTGDAPRDTEASCYEFFEIVFE